MQMKPKPPGASGNSGDQREKMIRLKGCLLTAVRLIVLVQISSTGVEGVFSQLKLIFDTVADPKSFRAEGYGTFTILCLVQHLGAGST
jgi:hypothetical protein